MSRIRVRAAFTIIELLVVVAIIALLIGILLPAIGKARDQAKLSQSLSNLRNIGTAHASYASEWNDRQLTLCDDNIAVYGTSTPPAYQAYWESHGGASAGEGTRHPGVALGWGYQAGTGIYMFHEYPTNNVARQGITQPLPFRSADGIVYYGSFRVQNCRQFNQYVSGRFYDKIFYAPKDTIPLADIEQGGNDGRSCFDDPGEYCDREAAADIGNIPTWSSYVMSPAAMYAPSMWRPGQWHLPFTKKGSFRSPSMGQALYSNLKTHVLEHHWLQSRRTECNPGFDPGTYDGCEPWYFNAAWESTPAALFYDGHVETVGVRKAERADGRQIAQTGFGLWSRDTTFGTDGYFIDVAYDQANTSFHILTTDGIRGRDFVPD